MLEAEVIELMIFMATTGAIVLALVIGVITTLFRE